MILFVFGGIMPAIIAISLKKKYGSQEEFRRFIKNIVNPKHHFAWYILIIIGKLINATYNGFCTVAPPNIVGR